MDNFERLQGAAPETPTEKLCREARENVERITRERDQLDQQVEALLSAIDAHRAERAHGATANLSWANQHIDHAADQVRKEREQ